MLRRQLLFAGLALAVSAASAPAASVTWTAASGNLAASAEFEAVGTDLVITLTNTSMSDVLAPADILTGVFFDILSDGPLSLSPVSAVLGPTSFVLYGIVDPGNKVGGEWAFSSSLVGAPGGADYGVSSAGLGLFGDPLFPGNNLGGPIAVNGLQYGITSAGDNPDIGNAAVTGGHALIQNQVAFTFSGLPEDFDPTSKITNVSFQYGTSLLEPNIPGVPEPATAALAGLAIAGLGRRAPRGRASA
jgi:hypothetical protein